MQACTGRDRGGRHGRVSRAPAHAPPSALCLAAFFLFLADRPAASCAACLRGDTLSRSALSDTAALSPPFISGEITTTRDVRGRHLPATTAIAATLLASNAADVLLHGHRRRSRPHTVHFSPSSSKIAAALGGGAALWPSS